MPAWDAQWGVGRANRLLRELDPLERAHAEFQPLNVPQKLAETFALRLVHGAKYAKSALVRRFVPRRSALDGLVWHVALLTSHDDIMCGLGTELSRRTAHE